MAKVKQAVLAGVALLFAVPAAAADAPVKVNSGAALKGVQKVVIGAFNLGFVFKSVDSGKATGGMIGAFGGTTKANAELAGVTPEMMQQVTDAAYADFKAQLVARGYQVDEADTLFNHAESRRIKPTTAPYVASVMLDKKSTGKASYFKPSALPSQFLLPGDVISTGMSGIGMNMAAGTNAYAVSLIAKSNNAAVIDVTYLIDFSNTKRPGAFSFGGLQVTGGMSVADDVSRAMVITPTGKTATLTLDQPVAVEGDFADQADTTKGAGLQKAGNILGGLAAVGGFGGLKFGKTKTFTFTAKPAWQEGATKAATLANATLINQLAALR